MEEAYSIYYHSVFPLEDPDIAGLKGTWSSANSPRDP